MQVTFRNEIGFLMLTFVSEIMIAINKIDNFFLENFIIQLERFTE